MKFLLAAVNAKYIHSNPAIYSLRAYAGEELRKYIELAEYTINQQMQDILADIYGRHPDAVGFSCYIWNWKMIRELTAELHKLLPHADIWLGGPEVSFDGEDILKRYPQVTGIMIGEGEATFRELLEYYVKKEEAGEAAREAGHNTKGPESVPGLYLRTGNTSPRVLTDFNTIPFLYEDMTPFENRIIYYESSRGCPYRCSYCLSSIDRTVRMRDMDVVKKELDFFLNHRVKQVKFVDRTFNCDHGHAMAVWEYIRENDNGVTNFHFEISADILREDEIRLLNSLRPGLVQLEIGVQSANPETLRAINRSADTDRLEKIVDAIRRGGNIHQHLDLIAGLPYEDYDSFGNSFNRVYGMKPEQLQLGFLKVLKGSPMHEAAESFGICYLDEPPYEVLRTKWLSYEDVLRLKGIEEMVELYYNSGQFVHTMSFLERRFPGPFSMYEALALFYREKGYFTNAPARSYRYQVLLKFAEKYDAGRLPVYRELLVFDMYLRENLKSRPGFAEDLSCRKETIREFYAKEEKERRYLPGYEAYDRKQLERMTHLEPFVYPVWDPERLAETVSEKENSGERAKTVSERQDSLSGYVLFDYEKRDPLKGQAAIQVLTGIKQE